MASSLFRALLCAASLVLLSGCERQSEEPPAGSAETGVKGIDRSQAGKPAPAIELRDSGGEPASLADSSGEPLLVNIWATWCAPCVKELPTLDALGRRPGALRVIAVSQDMAPRASVDAFLERLGLGGLETWHDQGMLLSGALGAEVLPTTIYFDSRGIEQWRYIGDLDWTGEEAARLLNQRPIREAAR